MKILLFTLEYPPFHGGVANYYAGLMRHFPGETVVLDNNGGKLLSRWVYPRWLPAVWRLFWAVRKERPDWVLVGHILPLGTVALIVRRFLPFKLAVFANGMDLHWSQKHPRKARLARRILSSCDRVIANSSAVAELAEDLGAGADKAEVVHPGLEMPVMDMKEEGRVMAELAKKYELRARIVFSLGRLVKRKGFDMVIKAWPEVKRECPDAVYLVAGVGPDGDYLKKLAAKLPAGIRDSVVFLGSVSDREKWALYRLCDLFVLPARDLDGDLEGFGIVYLEAGLRARPVLAGDSGGVRDAVEEDDNGLLCDPGSPEDIAEKIVYLLDRPEERRRMGEEGLMRAATKFNAKRQGERLFSILSS